MGDGSKERLAAELSDALGGAAIEGLERLSGGASRETWRFRGDGRDLVVQRQRATDVRDMLGEAAVITAARAAGVPVPELITARRSDAGTFMILEAVDGETIARKILRDDEFAGARASLVPQLGAALARIHAVDRQGLPRSVERVDQIGFYTDILDELDQPHPVLELVRNWLIDNQPDTTAESFVHGDFRLGNLIIGEDGLRAVIDWELAHLSDPMEDLGWLCVKAWRFGAEPHVAGVGDYDALFAAYEQAGGVTVDPDTVRWWEVLGTWKWGVMCILQANAHLTGGVRSHELAAIGRRVCENEYDLFLALEGRW